MQKERARIQTASRRLLEEVVEAHRVHLQHAMFQDRMGRFVYYRESWLRRGSYPSDYLSLGELLRSRRGSMCFLGGCWGMRSRRSRVTCRLLPRNTGSSWIQSEREEIFRLLGKRGSAQHPFRGPRSNLVVTLHGGTCGRATNLGLKLRELDRDEQVVGLGNSSVLEILGLPARRFREWEGKGIARKSGSVVSR